MGFLVLQETGLRRQAIIDGQQRLTTLSIVVLAALRLLEEMIKEGKEPESNTLRKEQIRSTYIGSLDPIRLLANSKLNLNRANNNFYQQFLIPLRARPKRGLLHTEQLMAAGFDWWFDALKANFHNGESLAKFIENRVGSGLFFTTITVNDDLNAYAVFETLIARGVKLTSTDLLKNYLFSL